MKPWGVRILSESHPNVLKVTPFQPSNRLWLVVEPSRSIILFFDNRTIEMESMSEATKPVPTSSLGSLLHQSRVIRLAKTKIGGFTAQSGSFVVNTFLIFMLVPFGYEIDINIFTYHILPHFQIERSSLVQSPHDVCGICRPVIHMVKNSKRILGPSSKIS